MLRRTESIIITPTASTFRSPSWRLDRVTRRVLALKEFANRDLGAQNGSWLEDGDSRVWPVGLS